MPFVFQEPAASPAVLRVWGCGEVGDRYSGGRTRVSPHPSPLPALASQPRPAPDPAPSRAPPLSPAPRPRQVEAARRAAARTALRALLTAAASTATGRSPATQFRSRGLPGDAAHSPRSRFCGEPSPSLRFCAHRRGVCAPSGGDPGRRPAPGQKQGALETAAECVAQAASPPVSLSDPQPKPLPASADGGLGRLRGCEDNLEHRLLELMSRESKGTSCLMSGRWGSGRGALPSVPTSLGWGCRQHGPLRAIDSHSGRVLRFSIRTNHTGLPRPSSCVCAPARPARVSAPRSLAVSALTEAAHCS